MKMWRLNTIPSTFHPNSNSHSTVGWIMFEMFVVHVTKGADVYLCSRSEPCFNYSGSIPHMFDISDMCFGPVLWSSLLVAKYHEVLFLVKTFSDRPSYFKCPLNTKRQHGTICRDFNNTHVFSIICVTIIAYIITKLWGDILGIILYDI